jgi:hypothetical protein
LKTQDRVSRTVGSAPQWSQLKAAGIAQAMDDFGADLTFLGPSE